MTSSFPISTIDIPPPPALDPTHEPTNTLALLLPHQALFSPPILQLLKDHYGLFGEIIHWAPVKAFGRVLIVFASEEDAENTKKEGDWLKLDLQQPTPTSTTSSTEETRVANDHDHSVENDNNSTGSIGKAGEKGYFSPGRKLRKSKPLKSELILRLHYLPPTLLHPDPSTTHLAPPALPHNFLISPPGSPPEGWEPIPEEGPNTTILAEDLQRALESLQLNGSFGKKGNGAKETILDEGGVRVEVEDTTKQDDVAGEESTRWDQDIEEIIDTSHGGQSIWNEPNQIHGHGHGHGHFTPSLNNSGSLSGMGTPSGKIKIAPTARPPM
ncbi:uncharacterized protein IL334_007554 [Kwoniella shivajii]|uniref:Calcineurin-binding protein n=1 Tax=Kwoniella shivajii TaxID=564305 RepID=A0ABZ1D8Z6_9TREE|nr:hypothetical protein IL334_007554 [Kwoniella shivajii]